MIRALIFDCFGVLYQNSEDYLAELAPGDVQRQELRDLYRACEKGFIERAEFLSNASRMLEKTEEEIAAVIRAGYLKNEVLIRQIETLKNTFHIALLSNMSSATLHHLFAPQELERLFEVVIVSGETGIAKPEPAIFSLAASRLGCLANECMMIDDSVRNCQGAESAGMISVVYTGVVSFTAALAMRNDVEST